MIEVCGGPLHQSPIAMVCLFFGVVADASSEGVFAGARETSDNAPLPSCAQAQPCPRTKTRAAVVLLTTVLMVKNVR